MIALQKSQKGGPAIPRHTRVLLGERAGVKTSYPSAKPPTKNHNVAQSFSPGLPRIAGVTPGKTFQNPAADCEAARSAKFICGHPIRPISPIRPIPPSHPPTHSHSKSTLAHPKSTVDLGCEPLIKVENSLLPALYKPLIRPENKGIQSISNRHRPKKFIINFCAWLPRRSH